MSVANSLQILVGRTSPAGNEAPFWPIGLSNPAFVAWAHRVSLRVLNLPDPGNALARRVAVDKAFFSEGVPDRDWALAYVFLLSLSNLKRTPSPPRGNCPPKLPPAPTSTQ